MWVYGDIYVAGQIVSRDAVRMRQTRRGWCRDGGETQPHSDVLKTKLALSEMRYEIQAMMRPLFWGFFPYRPHIRGKVEE